MGIKGRKPMDGYSDESTNNEKPWTSNAQWECHNRHALEFSTDYHETKEQAEAVCASLKRNGLGGEGKSFPLRTWVGNITERK
jgi:hypothetical protein